MPGFRFPDLGKARSRPHAPVAQLDRALPSEGRGQGFESLRARHIGRYFKRLVIEPSGTACIDGVKLRPIEPGYIRLDLVATADERVCKMPISLRITGQ